MPKRKSKKAGTRPFRKTSKKSQKRSNKTARKPQKKTGSNMRPKLKIQPKQKPKKISKKARKTQGTQKKQKIQKKKKVDRGIDSLVYDLFIYSSGLSTDTRTIQRGNFFIALSGERFDGNAYAHEAWDRDAICIVVSSISSELKRRISLNPGVKVHKVPDTHAFLCSLAAYHRQQFNIPVIAIAGSNGKTTTKELVMSVLRTKHKVLATAENENNSIGVSKTILRLNKKHELAVIELGTNRKGELKALCEIAKPNHGYITSIGKEHLEGFMDIRGVTEEETALYRYILKNNPDPMLFIPENVAELAPYAKIREIKNQKSQVISNVEAYDGLHSEMHSRHYHVIGKEQPEVNLEVEASLPHLRLRVSINPTRSRRNRNGGDISADSLSDKVSGESRQGETLELKTHLAGSWNVQNICAAFYIASFFDIPPKETLKAISNYKPKNMRSQVLPYRGATLILDAYNANPTSMSLVLEDFIKMSPASKDQGGIKKITVLGGMKELGKASDKEHRTLIDMLTEAKLTGVILIGEEFLSSNSFKKIFGKIKPENLSPSAPTAADTTEGVALTDTTTVMIENASTISADPLIKSKSFSGWKWFRNAREAALYLEAMSVDRSTYILAKGSKGNKVWEAFGYQE